MNKILIYRYPVIGSRRLSTLLWFLILFLGSVYFLWLSYMSYYMTKNLILNPLGNQIEEMLYFFPQGSVMGLYGILGFLCSLYLYISFVLKIGYGFNEFNKKEQIIRVFRWGFPGRYRRIEACYSIQEVKSIKIDTSFNNTILIVLKGDIEVPLTRRGFFDSIEMLEIQATEIALFLGVPLLYKDS